MSPAERVRGAVGLLCLRAGGTAEGVRAVLLRECGTAEGCPLSAWLSRESGVPPPRSGEDRCAPRLVVTVRHAVASWCEEGRGLVRECVELPGPVAEVAAGLSRMRQRRAVA